jgi:hypothetical protein
MSHFLSQRLFALNIGVLGLVLATAAVDAREVTVREGESLSMIAARELGSMDRWTEIARANNISDPRRLLAGTRLRIPGGGPGDGIDVPDAAALAIPPANLPSHVEGRPSVRRVAGAVRYRASEGAAWLELNASTELIANAEIMTANTGRADWITEDVTADLGPYSILHVLELPPSARAARVRLAIGDLTVRSRTTPVWVEVPGGMAYLESGDARVQFDEAGTLKVTALSGSAQFTSRDGRGPDGQRTTIEPGQQMIARRGAVPELKIVAQPIRLMSPAPRATVSDRDVMFEWATIPGARAYQFTLISEGEAQPRVTEQVAGGKLIVNNVPEGRYVWRVTPVGAPDVVASLPAALVVDRSAPPLELQPLVERDGMLRVTGRTAPNAMLRVGPNEASQPLEASRTLEVRADAEGAFSFDVGSADGIAIVGVEARTRVGGTPTRAVVAAAGRPMERTVPVRAMVPSGEVILNGDAAPSSVTLAEGENSFGWKWMLAGSVVGAGRLALTMDLSAPEITEIAMTPRSVQSGDELTIRVAARDRGTGLGDPSTAKISIAGPAGYHVDLVSEEKTSDGVYVFRFSTPKNLRSGTLHVSRLELSDVDGNGVILTSENMVAETTDPRQPFHRFLSGAFLIGVGVIIGAL